MRSFLIPLTLSLCLMQPAVSKEQCSLDLDGLSVAVTSDPCPTKDAARKEVELPLPHPQLNLIFRAVDVPNKGFWCSSQKVHLGKQDFSSGMGPFEAIVGPVDVFGNVATAEGQRYYLAKYEMTVLQAASILSISPDGKDVIPLEKGLSKLVDRIEVAGARNNVLKEYASQLKSVASGKLQKFLSGGLNRTENQTVYAQLTLPLRGLTIPEYHDILHRYNLWCFSDGACAEQLDRAVDRKLTRGFLRLPSEIEWEYAARSGGTLDDAEFSERTTPEGGKLNEFAVIADVRDAGRWQVKSIGHSRKPNGAGFYDILGNVQELVSDPFRALMLRGQVGSGTVRGGSVLTSEHTISFASRAEIETYRFDEAGVFVGPNRDPYTGIRPMIGGPIKQDPKTIDTAKNKYAGECSTKSIELVKSGSCDDPSDELRGLCRDLAAVSVELRDKNTRLCHVTAISAMELGRTMLRHSIEMAAARHFVEENEDASEAARKRQVARHRASQESAEVANKVYAQQVAVLREFEADCKSSAISSYLFSNKTAAEDNAEAFDGLETTVSKHVSPSSGRLTLRQISADYEQLGRNIIISRFK